MSKEEKIKNFDPNGIGNINNNIFGLPFNCEEAELIILPLPWEVTVSYSSGTAIGPEAIFNASSQIDLYEPTIKDAWTLGIAMDKISSEWKTKSDELRFKVENYIKQLEEGESWETNEDMKNIREEVNRESEKFNAWVKNETKKYLDKGKLVAGLGGDHSTPLGIMQALSEKYESFAILQLDAHADLRIAYEGFEYSHASIMVNALKIKNIEKLVQVGIRDYCESEVNMINNSNGRIKTFFDRDLKQSVYNGKSIASIQKEIIDTLPQNVYISFDIDAMDPKLCPNTGTPVAGGFEFEEVLYLIQQLVESGRKIIGFDLNEVAPGDDEWDANVGGRLLYRICNLMAKSQGKFND